MPYISCDGKMYSRYNQSPYVKECIRKREVAWNKVRAKEKAWAAAHPEEYAAVQREKAMPGYTIFCLFLAILIVAILWTWKPWCRERE